MCDDFRLTWIYIRGIFLDLVLICDDLRTTSECSAHIYPQYGRRLHKKEGAV